MAREYRAAVITLSDKGARGEREDTSGPAIVRIWEEAGQEAVHYTLLPDEKVLLEETLITLCDKDICDVIFTTGGTGLSPRDITPEATKAVWEREVPGIAEAIRAYSMQITKRAMLGRGVCGIRKKTLILNLPGSRKAVEESLTYILSSLLHGLDILREEAGECGRM